MNRINLLCIAVIMISCIGTNAEPQSERIDAIIDIPFYVPPSEYMTPTPTPILPTPLENLTTFLMNDETSENEWNVSADYVCIDFSIDLAHNLTDAGYKAGIVNIAPKSRHVGMWHCICWVELPDETVYIESQDDNIFVPDEYKSTMNDTIHMFREIKISSAERNRNDMHRWR